MFQGQFCDYCNAADPSKAHPVTNAIDGTERWWQSPPLSMGLKYNEVNVTLDLGQVSAWAIGWGLIIFCIYIQALQLGEIFELMILTSNTTVFLSGLCSVFFYQVNFIKVIIFLQEFWWYGCLPLASHRFNDSAFLHRDCNLLTWGYGGDCSIETGALPSLSYSTFPFIFYFSMGTERERYFMISYHARILRIMFGVYFSLSGPSGFSIIPARSSR